MDDTEMDYYDFDDMNKEEDDQVELDMQQYFCEITLRSKDALISDVKRRKERFSKRSETDNIYPAAFYSALLNLFDRFIARIENTVLFENLEMWWAYEYEVNGNGITLFLKHYIGIIFDQHGDTITDRSDEEFELFKVETKLLTVEEYSQRYGVEPVTVRQWIRRAKIRSVVKLGNEWRISELAVPNQRGYSAARYEWKNELSGLPDEFAFLGKPAELTITKEERTKDKFNISYKYMDDADGAKQKKAINEKERVQLEIFLITNPLVKYHADCFN